MKLQEDKKAEAITGFMHGLDVERNVIDSELTTAENKLEMERTIENLDALKAVKKCSYEFEEEARKRLTAELAPHVADPLKIASTFAKVPIKSRPLVLAAQAWVQSVTNLPRLDQALQYEPSTDGYSKYRSDPELGNVIEIPKHFPGHAVVHELGHLIEKRKPGVRNLAMDFLDYRTNGLPEIDLGYFDPDKVGDKGIIDHFDRHFDRARAAYCGYRYPGGDTEILSMGIEAIYSEPCKFAKEDPEFFQFIISCLIS